MFENKDSLDLASDIHQKLFALSPETDVVISVDPLHVAYLTGYRTCMVDVSPGYRMAAVANRDCVRLVTGRADAAPALELLLDSDLVYSHGTFVFSDENGHPTEDFLRPSFPDFDSALKAAVDDAVAPGDKISLDAAGDATHGRVCERLGLRGAASGRDHFLTSRRTKLDGEIARIQEAARITERGLTKALEAAQTGISETELASIIVKEMVAGGGIPRFIVVTSGERASLVDAYATSRTIAHGDLVRFDIACSFQGYWSDMARTAVVGEPTRLQQDRYDALLAGMEAEIDAVKPGVQVSEIFDEGVRAVRSGALPAYSRHHCGHGVGCLGHEAPTMGPLDPSPLESGMTLCLETPYYQPGWGGMMVEDMVLVTEAGARLLTFSDRALHII